MHTSSRLNTVVSPALTARHVCLLIAIAGVVFFTALGTARLWDRDEPRNAGCAVEMLQRGDWIVPMFNAELRVHKPVLLYWFQMTAYAMFGINEFAARFWSAALAVGTVLMTWLIGRRLFDETSGLWSGIALASCPLFVMAARAATPDSVLIFFTTLATLIYVQGVFEHGRPTADFFPTWGRAALMYAAMGMAVLAKGPVGFLLPMAVIGMFLLIARLPDQQMAPDVVGPARWRRFTRAMLRPFAPKHFLQTVWSMRPITAIVVILAVALPWYVWVGVRTNGEWLRGFLLVHNFGRIAEPMENHSGGPWYYPVTILVGTYPWILVLVPAIVSAALWIRRGDSLGASYVFLLCWACVYLGIFTLVRTKLPSYITPIYPALALLVGSYVNRWVRGEALPDELRAPVSFGVLALTGAGVMIGLVVAANKLLHGSQWIGVIGLIPIAGGLLCWMLANRGQRSFAAATLATVAITLVLGIFSVGTAVGDRYQQSNQLIEGIRAAHPAPRVASFGRLEPSWVYYLGQPIVEIPKEDLAQAAAFMASGDDTFVITTPERYAPLHDQLPREVQILVTIPYFQHEAKLILLGRAGSSSSASRIELHH